MSFLAPLFLAGAAAIALPFLFHLIRRSAKEKIPFSSLMFLEASPPRITKRSRLEHLLLLLLRCAVICLLALAFARPFFSKPVSAAPRANQSLHLAILIDTSASMGREDLWAQAKARAIEAVEGAPENSRVALFVFDTRLRAVLPFGESARLQPSEAAAEIESRLNAMGPGMEATHLGNAMLSAAEELIDQLNRESHEFGQGRIVVISDLQAGARLDGLQGFEWPKNIDVEVIPVAAEHPGNAGLHLLQAEARLSFATTNAPPRARVQNSAGSTREQFRVSWAENGVPAGEPAPVYVPPGESRIISPPPAPAGANQLILLDDPVEFDNRAWWVSEQRQEVDILHHGTPAPDNPREPLYYLKRAFEQPGSTLRVVPAGQASTNSRAGLMVATEPLDENARRVAGEMLDSGKTVLVVLRRPEIAQSLAPLLGIPTLPVSEAAVADYALLGQIDFTHSLFRPFAEARYSDFTKIHFWKHRQIDLGPLTNAIIAARFDSGDPFIIEIPVQSGRIVMLTSGWVTSESQFALSSKFVPLLYEILLQSLGEESTTHQFLVGDPVKLPGGMGGIEEITGPDNTRLRVNESVFPLPGLYRASEGALRFAVNMDPSESRVQPLAPEDLEALGVPMGVSPASGASRKLAATRQQHRLATEAESQQKLWRNLLLVAVGVLFLEMFLAGRLSRTPAAVPA